MYAVIGYVVMGLLALWMVVAIVKAIGNAIAKSTPSQWFAVICLVLGGVWLWNQRQEAPVQVAQSTWQAPTSDAPVRQVVAAAPVATGQKRQTWTPPAKAPRLSVPAPAPAPRVIEPTKEIAVAPAQDIPTYEPPAYGTFAPVYVGDSPTFNAPLPTLDMSREVHVRGYTRQDGTYVRPSTRSAPGHGRR